MSTPLQPLGDYVVAVAEEAQTKTASGLYLPDSAKEKSGISTVVAVGPAVQGIKVGEKIVYKEYSSTTIKMGKEQFFLVKEEDILAMVK